jgi:hypothetical protein
MLGLSGNRKLRRLYHDLMLPETAATAPKLAIAPTTRANMLIEELLLGD